MILPLLNLDFQKRLLFLLEKYGYKWLSDNLPTEKYYIQATYLSFSNKNLQYGVGNCCKTFLKYNEMKYFPEDSERLNRFI